MLIESPGAEAKMGARTVNRLTWSKASIANATGLSHAEDSSAYAMSPVGPEEPPDHYPPPCSRATHTVGMRRC